MRPATTGKARRSAQGEATRRDYQLGLVHRADGFEPEADEAGGAAPLHAMQLAHPDHDVVVCEGGLRGAGGRHCLPAQAPQHVEESHRRVAVRTGLRDEAG